MKIDIKILNKMLANRIHDVPGKIFLKKNSAIVLSGIIFYYYKSN